ncbi:MAG: energy transducer TonB, partial [Myxococcales bacterium]|nr:energy transducer TonB [Myxococcales bacterium]
MDLASWTSKGSDPARIRRLGVGYVVGGLAVVGLVLGLSRMAVGAPFADDEDALDVTLASAPPAPTPEPVAAEPPAAPPSERPPAP